MTLREKQVLFSKLVPRLIDKIFADGYECSIAFVKRCAECPVGKSNSVHKIKLAIDIDLFCGGEYMADTLSHLNFGEYWESLHPLCRWGGRFKKADGNHYSLEEGGRA